MKTFSSEKYFELISNISVGFKKSKEYTKVLDISVKAYKNNTVFTMGCGGSAQTATHFAADLAKTVNDKKGFRAISLVDNAPLISAWANDFGWESIFEGQLRSHLAKNDVLVGFSVHGGTDKWSNNLTKAMKLAKKRGAKIIGFSGFDGGAMKEMSDACLVVPLDYEPYGTPVIEAMHVVLTHGLIFDLREWGKKWRRKSSFIKCRSYQAICLLPRT